MNLISVKKKQISSARKRKPAGRCRQIAKIIKKSIPLSQHFTGAHTEGLRSVK
jgi:hypothetical protein